MINKNTIRFMLLVIVLGAAILAGVGYARQWPFFGRVVGTILPTPLAQNIGHVVLFAVVGILFLALIPQVRKHFVVYLVVILAVAGSQELFELSLRRPRPSASDALDLLLDLGGALLGYLLFMISSRLLVRWRLSRNGAK